MKKLMAMLMALMMAVCVFSACSKEEKKETKNNETPAVVETNGGETPAKSEEKTDSADAVVEDFMKALASLEIEADDYDKFFAEDAGYEDEYKELVEIYAGIPDMLTEELSGMDEMFGPDFEGELMNIVSEKVADVIEYEIKDVEENGDKATVKAALLAPDFENVEPDEEAMSKAAEKAFGFDINDEAALMEAWMEKEGLKSEEELMEKFSTASEDEIMESVMSLFTDGMADFIDELFDATLKDAKKDELIITFEVEKQGNDWKIVEMN